MAAVPTAERPPRGLDAYWLGHWRHCLKQLKEQGTWRWEQRPLLDEYVFALKAAEDARNGFEWLDHLRHAVASEDVDFVALQSIASGLPTQWDRHTKRAASLAETLVLTPRAQRAHGVGARARPQERVDPKVAAANELEQLGQRGHLRAVS